MATIDTSNGNTKVGNYGEANLFWIGREDSKTPFILDVEGSMITWVNGRAHVHVSRETIRQLADVAPTADQHLTALETWEEEQAYDAYVSTLDVEEECDRGDDL